MRFETFKPEARADAEPDLNATARRRLLSVRGEPLFLADWLQAVFIHYEVPAAILQRDVPFPLDLFDGKAYVSLVAFTMRRMRPCFGGRLMAWMFRPIATNDFLNVRTYVRNGNETGIYFLTEWMNNRLSVRLGPITFGLPYRLGRLDYHHDQEAGILRGAVAGTNERQKFSYQAGLSQTHFAPCPAGSLDEFLLERYTAFTAHGPLRRFFRIWHAPWPQTQIEVAVRDVSLPESVWPWFSQAGLIGGNYSPGAREVWMGRPHRVGRD